MIQDGGKWWDFMVTIMNNRRFVHMEGDSVNLNQLTS